MSPLLAIFVVKLRRPGRNLLPTPIRRMLAHPLNDGVSHQGDALAPNLFAIEPWHSFGTHPTAVHACRTGVDVKTYKNGVYATLHELMLDALTDIPHLRDQVRNMSVTAINGLALLTYKIYVADQQ